MEWHLVLVTFGLIFPVELPDKTFVAALVLSTRYRPLAVWIGVGLAFAVQCLVAVSAGHLVSLLPDWVIQVVSTAMFFAGAVILYRTAAGAEAAEKAQEESFTAKAAGGLSAWRAVGASFLVLFAAEWGDLSQLLTLNLAAKYEAPVSVFIGAWAALLAVSGLAVLGGRVLLSYLRLSWLHYLSATVCLVFATVGVVQLTLG